MFKTNNTNQRWVGFIFLFLFSVLGLSWISGETYKNLKFAETPEKVCELSDKVNETSGIIYFDGAIWTFNDSGGKPELYRIDKKTGKINRIVSIENAKNQDWEDITMDDEFIYIGDFGNNWGTRKNLVIYKIPQKDIMSGNSSVTADLIHISYTDQDSFEKMNRSHNFDCESVISYGDSLILFSKNWVDGNSRLYKLPKSAGSYQLSPYDTFYTNGLITGADYFDKTKKLALIGYNDRKPFVFILEDFNGLDFSSDQIYKIKIPKLNKSQTEGICWTDDHTLMISSEGTKSFKQSLYELSLEDILNSPEVDQ